MAQINSDILHLSRRLVLPTMLTFWGTRDDGLPKGSETFLMSACMVDSILTGNSAASFWQTRVYLNLPGFTGFN